MSDLTIRLAASADITFLCALEHDAGQRFRDVGMDDTAGITPAMFEERMATDNSDVFVAEASGELAGLIIVEQVANVGFIEEVSVAQKFAGRRIGATLIKRAEIWTQECGGKEIYLTTFVHVPWNAPYYERLGYQVTKLGRAPLEIAKKLKSELQRFANTKQYHRQIMCKRVWFSTVQ